MSIIAIEKTDIVLVVLRSLRSCLKQKRYEQLSENLEIVVHNILLAEEENKTKAINAIVLVSLFARRSTSKISCFITVVVLRQQADSSSDICMGAQKNLDPNVDGVEMKSQCSNVPCCKCEI